MILPRCFRLFALTAILGGVVTAPLAAAAGSPTADQAFEAARAAILTRTPEGDQALAAGFAFFLGFPEDPRTRGLLPALVGIAPLLPEAARPAYLKAYDERITAALARPDLPDAAREGILAAGAATELDRQMAATTPDPAVVRARLDALAARFPRSPSVGALEVGYANLIVRTDPAAGEAQLEKLAASADPAIAGPAGAALRLAQLRTKPLEMKFTAADGRAVDLAALRGKVVLIDFWATWCGPCLRELPNLTRVYGAYHDQGFEVVGIAFENAGVVDEAALRNPRNAGKAQDGPEEASAKKARAKVKLLEFTREKGMPWPQHFDGNYWDNAFGRQYEIRSIPAMFLLDKSGRVVETEARGERLEPLVRKLLGLDS